jgi:hypothetical protein
MLRRAGIVTAVLLLTGTSWAWAAGGGGFDLSWFSMDGGGGPSSSGGYAVTGTAGQLDAGALSGNGYHLAGGLWPAQFPAATADHGVYLPLVGR